MKPIALSRLASLVAGFLASFLFELYYLLTIVYKASWILQSFLTCLKNQRATE